MTQEVVSIDGEIVEGWKPTCRVVDYNVVNTLQVKRKTVMDLVPVGLILKARLPGKGFYVPHDVNIAITPHISENTGTRAKLGIRDSRDMNQSRYLYQSPEFNLGIGLRVTGTQLPFCLPMGEFPIQLELMVLHSAFQGHAKICTISCQWSLTWASAPFSRVQSAFKSDVVKRCKSNKVEYLQSKENRSRSKVNYITGGQQGAVVRSKPGKLGMRSHSANEGVAPELCEYDSDLDLPLHHP